MEEKEKEVLESVRKIFMRYGIRSVTMDDISREIKISKKTLYKYVSDKSDLVRKVVVLECAEDVAMVAEILQKAENAIDEILMITSHICSKVQQFHPSIHYDLEKYYPEAWEVFSDHKATFILRTVTENLHRGIREGLYRENMKPEILARIYVARVDMIFDGQLFPQPSFNFLDVLTEMIRYHVRGIASEKGIRYLSARLQKDLINI